MSRPRNEKVRVFEGTSLKMLKSPYMRASIEEEKNIVGLELNSESKNVSGVQRRETVQKRTATMIWFRLYIWIVKTSKEIC